MDLKAAHVPAAGEHHKFKSGGRFGASPVEGAQAAKACREILPSDSVRPESVTWVGPAPLHLSDPQVNFVDRSMS